MRGNDATTVTTIETSDEARALAAHLHAPERNRPVALISIAVGREEPSIDAARIARELAGAVDVYTIATGPLTFAFRDAMPRGTEAYGGAGRIYPIGTEWVRDLHLSPLRFAFDAEHAARTTNALIDDGHRMSDRARTSARNARKPRLLRVEAEVGAVLGGTRALVRTGSGQVATIAQERIVEGLPIPLDWLLSDGMRLHGLLDEQAGSFTPERPRDPASLANPYETGSVVLAMVSEVAEHTAALLLHPWLRIGITTADVSSNASDTLSMLLTPGDVVPTRLLRRPDGRIALRLADVGDGDPVQDAIPFAPGGAPWLLPERSLDLNDETRAREENSREEARTPHPLPAPAPKPAPGPRAGAGQATAPRPASVRPAPRPSAVPTPGDLARSGGTVAVPDEHEQAPASAEQETRPLLNELRIEVERERLRRVRAEHRIKELEQHLTAVPSPPPPAASGELRTMAEAYDEERAQTAEQLSKQKDENDRLKNELRRVKSELRRSRRSEPERVAQPLDFDAFPNPDDAVRYAVLTTWVTQIPSYDKIRQPLPEYRIGPEFSQSLREFDEDRQSKALRAIVDLLVGNKNRTSHHLKHGDTGPRRTRAEDGAIAWRIYIEENTPQARRLHYWMLRGGEVELAKVVLHDDYSI